MLLNTNFSVMLLRLFSLSRALSQNSITAFDKRSTQLKTSQENSRIPWTEIVSGIAGWAHGHKILKPNIAVGSFWVARLGVAPSMSNMHWKRYIFKARQRVNWYTVIFSLKTFEQFLKVFKPLTTWWLNSSKMTIKI